MARRKTLRAQLADAKRTIRHLEQELKGSNHDVTSLLEPERARARQAENAAREANVQVARLSSKLEVERERAQERLSDAELVGLAALVTAAGIDTPERATLRRALVARGVLTGNGDI